MYGSQPMKYKKTFLYLLDIFLFLADNLYKLYILIMNQEKSFEPSRNELLRKTYSFDEISLCPTGRAKTIFSYTPFSLYGRGAGGEGGIWGFRGGTPVEQKIFYL